MNGVATAASFSAVAAFAGDWHGASAFANARLQSLGERGIKTVLHVGDLGIWPGPTGKQFLRTLDRVCGKFDQALLVTPGNHEDWGRLMTLWENPKHRAEDGSLLPLHLTDHITVLPRGYRWQLQGRTFVSLGGAPSVDFEYRTLGKDWWDTEQLTAADVDRTVQGGSADVMVTHDAPGPPWCVPQVAQILATNPMGWSDRALEYARLGRERVTEAFLGVKPRLLVHGHYHVSDQTSLRLPGTDYDTTVWSLSMNGKDGNVRLLDLQSLNSPQQP